MADTEMMKTALVLHGRERECMLINNKWGGIKLIWLEDGKKSMKHEKWRGYECFQENGRGNSWREENEGL